MKTVITLEVSFDNALWLTHRDRIWRTLDRVSKLEAIKGIKVVRKSKNVGTLDELQAMRGGVL